ncbi:diguanylate phosphodiesterase [Falsiroseomonas bella]|uniref:Diguanylate phosphodiesterase n=1 Tax=Falsiroseomonas bella TaxID=2184016 RepID=A0A317FDB8_9PROT|nr:EAL domain-containing protein [Falsiroseomonas bella]PWS36513.1 diguanylate phosphodiesterase [Falsiroseomonas bella]
MTKISSAWPDPAFPGRHVIQDALIAIRNHLGMEVAYLSEFLGDRSVFRHVDAPGLEHLIKPGDSMPLADVYCTHILEGRLPELIPDTAAEPLARALPITRNVPIGAHASLPIRLPDGSPYGMFCCLSPRPNPTLNRRDLETMRVFAGLAARQVNAELEAQRQGQARRAALDAVMQGSNFSVVFQPIMDLARMSTVSCEALCRFSPQPYRSPDKWFRDAAEAGLAVDLELMVIERALAALDALPQAVTLSVNASPETILSGRLEEALIARHLPRTVLELTEHAMVPDYGALQSILAPLKNRGLKIAADDAGAGYSGLQHLIQLQPDIIKMDMSLTRSLDADPARRALASAMTYYARETRAILVAEGIETEAELATLRSLGVDRGQGYLLGRPAPLAALLGPALAAAA